MYLFMSPRHPKFFTNLPPYSRLSLINLIHRLLHISSLSWLLITFPPVPESLTLPAHNKCGQKSFSHCLRTFFSLYLDHILKLGTDHGTCLSPTFNSPSDSWSLLSIRRTISMKLCTHYLPVSCEFCDSRYNIFLKLNDFFDIFGLSSLPHLCTFTLSLLRHCSFPLTR